jgi:hypothetical protein
MRASLIAVVLSAVFSLMACAPFESDAGSRPPQTRLNPHPVRAYRVSLTLKDAPGPFLVVEGIVDYAAKYRDNPARTCGYMAGGVGAFVALSRSEFFELKKVAENTYEGVVYADGVLDEDYDGEGICHWDMIEVRARLRANDNQTDTRFAPFMQTTPDMTEKSEVRYFFKGAYPHAGIDDFPYFGDSDRSLIHREDGQLFTMVLYVKEIDR